MRIEKDRKLEWKLDKKEEKRGVFQDQVFQESYS